MNESCHTYERDMPHIWMNHVTHMNHACHTWRSVMSHTWMSHVTNVNQSYHTPEWVMSHISMSHVTHRNKSCHTYEWVMSHVFTLARVHTHIHIHIHKIHTHTHTHTHTHHHTHTRTHTEHICGEILDSFNTERFSVLYTNYVKITTPNMGLYTAGPVAQETGSSFTLDMGWLPLVGSLKLQVSFAKEP